MIDLNKFQRDFDVYSDPLSAKAKSQAMGLNGAIHVYDVDGQAYYMPGATHKEYLEAMEFEDYSEEDLEEVTEDRMTEALRAVVAEIMGKSFEDWGEPVAKAEYQGEEVPLNQPRRLSGGNKKFEVFVRDGDKVKRVTFGDPDMEIRRDDDEARASFRARHNCDSKKDKTTAGYWACRSWEADTTVSDMTKQDTDFEAYGEVTKMDEDQRIVYGYASVISKDGEPIVDRQGDIITAEELEKAASDFMLGARVGKTMHKGDATTTIIHSFPMTNETKKAYQIESPLEAWLIAVKVHDDETWDKVKQGELKDFSIGGKAQRRDV